jgi:ubiquinone/menaquinone biosynthesis C-methylase UbiE
MVIMIWNKIAEQWNSYRKKPVKEVKNFLKNKKGRILDLGCGSGRNFVKNKGIIYGVDNSKKMLNLARKNARQRKVKVNLKKENIKKLNFKDNFFNYAICISVLQYLNKEDRKKAEEELFRVLKSGGEGVISVWSKNQKRFKNKPKKIEIPWKVNRRNYKRKVYLYNKKELKRELEKVGFEIIKDYKETKFSKRNITIKIRKP